MAMKKVRGTTATVEQVKAAMQKFAGKVDPKLEELRKRQAERVRKTTGH